MKRIKTVGESLHSSEDMKDTMKWIEEENKWLHNWETPFSLSKWRWTAVGDTTVATLNLDQLTRYANALTQTQTLAFPVQEAFPLTYIYSLEIQHKTVNEKIQILTHFMICLFASLKCVSHLTYTHLSFYKVGNKTTHISFYHKYVC